MLDQLSPLTQRVITALVLAPLAIACVLWLPSPGFAVVLGLIFCYGLWEWSRLIGLQRRRVRSTLVLLNAVAMATLWWLFRTQPHALLPLVYVGVGWWFLALLWLRSSAFAEAPTRRNLELKWLVGSLVTLPAWCAAWILHASDQGPWWTLFTLVLIWAGDSGAYFFGRAFGRVKLAPSISPGKTREGLYGGLLASGLFAALAGVWLLDGRIQIAALVGLAVITILFSVVGDLFESLIKRQSKQKDSGTLFPGHGGMLDRLDSVFAALPIFVAGKFWLGL
ncbi:MAG: phosphatidate cytidylyltransferase [Xanthomonadales bacterium]|nr:phosphatidate cytidylyltransferase [Xanthomonadales bacterium]MCB1640270.1 phosphatidate cytidylyltransferase [Xanthomonadales bacterium]